MFQEVPPPIIRSSKLYTQHRVFVALLLLLTAYYTLITHAQRYLSQYTGFYV